MNNFTYHNPTRIHFGQGQIAKLSEEIPADAKVLITYGGGSIKKNGVLGQVHAALQGRNYQEFGGIEANPHFETLMQAVEIVQRDGIDYILAERDYMRIFTAGQSYMIADSMAAMAQRMAPMGFLRIHRSILVRQAAIRGLLRRRYGTLAVRLEDATELGVGRSYVQDVLQVLGLKPLPGD